MKLSPRCALVATLLTARCLAFCGASRLKAVGASSVVDSASGFDHLRQSIIRIQAVSVSFDWLLPFQQGQDQVGLGSGFVVQAEPYPLFVTNQHVINDAKQVTVQLLLFGEHQWEAEVVSVCPRFDLALLVLKSSREFNEAMASRNITLQPLPIASRVAAMGEDVVALGFPLGQDALKISKGNIAGNEEVDGNICIQSTAPISPGNSGGPLLDGAAKEVVGVNFAKATEGENINYVIPAWRVSQMVRKHLKDQPRERGGPGNLLPKEPTFRRLPVQVPRSDLVTIESNDALYEASGGCAKGVYIAKVGRRSFFTKASPPVRDGSFLVSVNGVELDEFGMGLNAKYAADRVFFNDLFFMVPDLSTDIEVEICYQGKLAKHSASTAFLPEYDRGLRWVAEPGVEGSSAKFEMFGDLSVMELTVNHVHQILQQLGDAFIARWLHPDFVAEPRLVINFVRSGSYSANVLSAGSVVTKVNGHEVRTLDDFRQHFEPLPGSNVWTLETDMGQVAALMFNKSMVQQLALATSAPYLLTPGVQGAAKKMGLIAASPEETASATQPVSAQANPKAAANATQPVSSPKGAANATQPISVRLHTTSPQEEQGGAHRSKAASLLEAVAAGPLVASPVAAGAGRRSARATKWAGVAPQPHIGAQVWM